MLCLEVISSDCNYDVNKVVDPSSRRGGDPQISDVTRSDGKWKPLSAVAAERESAGDRDGACSVQLSSN